MQDVRTVIIGAGAAGLMCAAHAGGDTLLIDHARAPGEKIRISGGGRCNFTNIHTGPENFLSQNPHFAKSALARYSPWDFVDLIGRHGIAWHEKTLGQLFCDGSAKQIVSMLVTRAQAAGTTLRLQTSVREITHADGQFTLRLEPGGLVRCRHLVVASGGKSIPKMGASGFGHDIARQFGHTLTEIRPALVPLTFGDRFAPLSGVSLPAQASAQGTRFDEAVLFTHRGLSGPAILQISSFWREGGEIALNLLPGHDGFAALRALRADAGKRAFASCLSQLIPAKLASHLAQTQGWEGRLADFPDTRLRQITARLQNWQLRPTGSEGYRTAEVTLGGVETGMLEARSMQSRHLPGLYFIGEVVDVTGWLGGFNFQWAWASGHACGQAIAQAPTP